MMSEFRKDTLTLVILAGWLVAMALFWPTAPDRLPTHMGHTGEIDGHGGKFMGLLFMPLMGVAMYLVLLVIPRRDPSFREGPNRVARFPEFRLIITLVLLLAHLVVLFQGLYPHLGLAPFIPALIGALFILVGNHLGKTRPNRFLGVRTPWTFKSKLAWVGANRLAGWLMVGEGLVLLGLALIRPVVWFPFFTVATLLLVLVSVIYSFVLYRRDPDPRSPFPMG